MEKKSSIYVINLDRKIEKWGNFLAKNAEKLVDFKVDRFSAIDGQKITANKPLLKIYEACFENLKRGSWDIGIRTGVVGVSLSHLLLFQKIIDQNEEFAIIFEDDIIIAENFEKNMKSIIDHFLTNKVDVLYLGLHPNPYNSISLDKLWNFDKDIKIENFFESKINHVYGSFGYIISKDACNKILNMINKNGMHGCYDAWILQQTSLKIELTFPSVLYSFIDNVKYNIKNEVVHNTDSDVQVPMNILQKWENFSLEDVKNVTNPLMNELGKFEVSKLVTYL
jgi:glycosyl transferase family 25